jgi:hypothetical protein
MLLIIRAVLYPVNKKQINAVTFGLIIDKTIVILIPIIKLKLVSEFNF